MYICMLAMSRALNGTVCAHVTFQLYWCETRMHSKSGVILSVHRWLVTILSLFWELGVNLVRYLLSFWRM